MARLCSVKVAVTKAMHEQHERAPFLNDKANQERVGKKIVLYQTR